MKHGPDLVGNDDLLFLYGLLLFLSD